ncbi:DUF1481 domain-containing protein [Brenneria populi subsp. brevivirga]|uniref:DUF1481 domain-containing protein n=1 Tax=Brenneria populi TaxID=1505588 RepID=UPI002E17872B|nr:DUF1481 domain-containing protein [Brenneria populi subsp. brevivirga]
MLLWRRLGIGIAIFFIAACSSHTPAPAVFASGYISDRGIVRLWRKDDAQRDTVRLIAVYNPFQGGGTVVTRYWYQQGGLREIKRSREDQKDDTQIRFAEGGAVSFMQRQLAARREPISDEDLAFYQWDAQRVRELSDVLQAGNVTLKQGTLRDDQITACDGSRISPDFDRSSQDWIAQRRAQLTGPLSIAWLEASEGTQLLLVDRGDFCRWEAEANRL